MYINLAVVYSSWYNFWLFRWIVNLLKIVSISMDYELLFLITTKLLI